MRAFSATDPHTERHAILRKLSANQPPKASLHIAFRFLLRLDRSSNPAEADALYQQRGLSADPFADSAKVLAEGFRWLRSHTTGERKLYWLIGPGAEFGSRFGLDDRAPIRSPQPSVVRGIADPSARIDCTDVRIEVIDSLKNADCRAYVTDIVLDRPSAAPYDIAIATNLFLYLDEIELALAMDNIASGLRPGGCLLHNDPRFAARHFGATVSLPAIHFRPIILGTSALGVQRMDRFVIHCKSS
jgi:SAM-dependent methyltransferase